MYTALQLAKGGVHVLCLRLQDRPRPRAESLRNQGWLRSGLSELTKGLEHAHLIRRSGRQLHDNLFGGSPQASGILLPKDEGTRAKALEVGKSWGVAELSKREARDRLGPAFQEGASYLRTPESTFDEGEILTELRLQAHTLGADLHLVEDPVELEIEGGLAFAKVGSTRIEAERIVLAAGAGNRRLLGQVGLTYDYEVHRTPLLVVKSRPLSTGVFICSPERYSVVCHGDRMVVGIAGEGISELLQPGEERGLSEGQVKAFEARLPKWLAGLSSRLTAGYEIKQADGGGLGVPRVARFEAVSNLLVAHPARATLASFAAEEVEAALNLKGLLPDPPPRDQALPGRAWGDDEIHMHFHPSYDDFEGDVL